MADTDKIIWFSTTETEPWKKMSYAPPKAESFSELVLSEEFDQVIDGFGACFNELCEIALRQLPDEQHEKVLDLLYSPGEDGLRLNFCRMPIGASDYAESWYSYDEADGDYEMEHFSIDRDRRYLLPMIRGAFERNGNIRLFASPWSPPTWMKYPKAYNFGTLVMDEKNLRAYALYFAKFAEAYRAEGIRIDAIHVQNEPFADQKFPSCRWTGEQFITFIGKYLGPLFEERGIDTDIFLGTVNSDEVKTYNDYVCALLLDPDASRYTAGIGLQWASKAIVPLIHESFPEVYTVQTENECGDGENTWEYAKYIYGLFRHYLTNGVRAYTYWNPVLASGGMSTWGWQQNSMITVENGTYRLNPEYYVMKHFSRFIRPGAQRLRLYGHPCSDSAAFRNPGGEIVLVTRNPFPHGHTVRVTAGCRDYAFDLPADSINTIVIE